MIQKQSKHYKTACKKPYEKAPSCSISYTKFGHFFRGGESYTCHHIPQNISPIWRLNLQLRLGCFQGDRLNLTSPPNAHPSIHTYIHLFQAARPTRTIQHRTEHNKHRTLKDRERQENNKNMCHSSELCF